MRKLLWLLYQPYKWLFFIPLLCVSGMIFLSIAAILAITGSPNAGSMFAGIGWSRLIGFFTPMPVSVSGLENIDRKQSYVVVSNHQSHFDVFIISGWLHMDLKWVMKKELRKMPFLGYATEKVGYIIIDRSDRNNAIKQLNAAKNKIKDGTSVMFFPEGTRSKDGNIGEFKKGAFLFALQLGLPILPVTINGTRKILPRGGLNLMPGRAGVIVHAPIDTSKYSENNYNELIEHSRNIIIESFKTD